MNYRNESEVMYAIRKFLDEHQIPFNVEEKSQHTNYIYDFYLPEGLKNAKLPLGKGYVKYEIGGPVAIEVKGRLLFDTIQRYVTLFTEVLAPQKGSFFFPFSLCRGRTTFIFKTQSWEIEEKWILCLVTISISWFADRYSKPQKGI